MFQGIFVVCELIIAEARLQLNNTNVTFPAGIYSLFR